jgi:hypothetical protein
MSQSAHRLPVPMTTVFRDVFLLTYAVPPAGLATLLPPGIQPYVRNGWSYVSIVAANIQGMRPQPLPEFLGANYYQIVYRAVVRRIDAGGEEHPGVFFLRSDGNDPVMSYFGNHLTEFRFHYFHTGAISFFTRDADVLVSVESADGKGDLVASLRNEGPAEALPPAEGFESVAEEKEILVQLFHAFAYDGVQDTLYDLEIERGEWSLQRLSLVDRFSAFFEEGPFHAGSTRPVSHLYIRDCRYVWKPMTVIPVGR